MYYSSLDQWCSSYSSLSFVIIIKTCYIKGSSLDTDLCVCSREREGGGREREREREGERERKKEREF